MNEYIHIHWVILVFNLKLSAYSLYILWRQNLFSWNILWKIITFYSWCCQNKMNKNILTGNTRRRIYCNNACDTYSFKGINYFSHWVSSKHSLYHEKASEKLEYINFLQYNFILKISEKYLFFCYYWHYVLSCNSSTTCIHFPLPSTYTPKDVLFLKL